MPTFEFLCGKCKKAYDEIVPFDGTGKYKGIKCPDCGSKKKSRMPTTCGIKFANPRESSKWDNFSFRAGKTQEEAADCRRNAEAASHMGTNPYGGTGQIEADLNNDSLYGEVK